MSKQQVGASDQPVSRERPRWSRRTALAGALVICLAAGFAFSSARISLDQNRAALALASVLPLLLALALAHALEAAPLSAAWRYRLAFAISALIALLAWLVLRISPRPDLPLALLAVELLAAFAGWNDRNRTRKAAVGKQLPAVRGGGAGCLPAAPGSHRQR